MTNKLTHNTHGDKGNCSPDDNYLVAIDGTIFDEKYLNRLSKALTVITLLPSGNDWVCIIGNGDEENNGEALKSWVSRQLDHLIDHNAAQHIDILLRKFQDLANDFY